MKVAVVGATGNSGTSLLDSLAEDDRIGSVLGIARRLPDRTWPKTKWLARDVSRDDLRPAFEGMDAVVHLAWLIQPSRDQATLRATNVDGSKRVFEAAAAAGVPALVYASSVGTYSPGPKDSPVDESWPAGGISTSFYSRHKAEVERILDAFEASHPEMRVVRLRPALIFKREAASGIRRLFAGPFLPGSLLRRGLIPMIPVTRDLVFQAVHSHDVGNAYRLALTEPVRGAFNVAADPIIDQAILADIFGARSVRMPPRALRAFTTATWKLRLQPTPPGWLDMGLETPTMDTTRARGELGWTPRHTSVEALRDLLGGLQDAAGLKTPPLDPATTGPLRIKELVTGVGRR